MSATSQYYSHLPSLSNLATYVQQKICKTSEKGCKEAASSLVSASYLDIDYDTISHALVLNAFWSSAPDNRHWTETIAAPARDESIEVGVLTHEKNPDPEDIAFGGFLTVLGQDSKPSTSRHLLLCCAHIH